MLDTNVIISAGLFPSKTMTAFIESISMHHRIVLCSYCLDELYDVIQRKFPNKLHQIEIFLQKLPFELISIPIANHTEIHIDIRDDADYPVLMSAILADVDILITGDKDFMGLSIDKPEILTPSEFIEQYA